MKIPKSLLSDEARPTAVAQLRRYYGLGADAGPAYTGAQFDTWDSARTRAASADVFTADDLVAVSLLSVDIKASAAVQLLDDRAAEFAALLQELGPDRDLASEPEPLAHDWVGSTLFWRLEGLPGVGPTRASKLFARKRPRLRPIYDSVVERTLETTTLWEPLRLALRTGGLHDRLIALRDEAGLTEEVSALRVFDVVVWMTGTGGGASVPDDR